MTRIEPGSCIDTLRERTRSEHDMLEQTRYARAVQGGEVALESYAGHLQALAIIHAVLERCLSQSAHPVVQRVWADGLSRLSLLEEDLAHLRAIGVAEQPAAAACAARFASRILLKSADDPVALLGTLYVLQGSAWGAARLRDGVQRALNLPGEEGLRYLTYDRPTLDESWNRFREAMNAAVAPEDNGRLGDEAVAAFRAVREIFECLEAPNCVNVPLPVTALNPEAGSHPVPADPREVAAALEAGAICLRRFPYLDARFGARGRRFTASDGAWLVTLSEGPLESACEQVFWLGGLLASRGMPRFLLETHLDVLHGCLLRARPEDPGRYRNLALAAERLRAVRTKHLPEGRFDALAGAFERAVSAETRRVENMGALLVAAVSDEKEGIENAVGSIEGWAVDPERFSTRWIGQVRRTVAAARGALNELPGEES